LVLVRVGTVEIALSLVTIQLEELARRRINTPAVEAIGINANATTSLFVQ
jgi:hypothetical protein